MSIREKRNRKSADISGVFLGHPWLRDFVGGIIQCAIMESLSEEYRATIPIGLQSLCMQLHRMAIELASLASRLWHVSKFLLGNRKGAWRQTCNFSRNSSY
jgi:hypothetical protein